MNENTIKALIRLGLVLLEVGRDLARTQGMANSEIAARAGEKADKAIKEGQAFLDSLED